jgi:hypothetical protein
VIAPPLKLDDMPFVQLTSGVVFVTALHVVLVAGCGPASSGVEGDPPSGCCAPAPTRSGRRFSAGGGLKGGALHAASMPSNAAPTPSDIAIFIASSSEQELVHAASHAGKARISKHFAGTGLEESGASIETIKGIELPRSK